MVQSRERKICASGLLRCSILVRVGKLQRNSYCIVFYYCYYFGGLLYSTHLVPSQWLLAARTGPLHGGASGDGVEAERLAFQANLRRKDSEVSVVP